MNTNLFRSLVLSTFLAATFSACKNEATFGGDTKPRDTDEPDSATTIQANPEQAAGSAAPNYEVCLPSVTGSKEVHLDRLSADCRFCYDQMKRMLETHPEPAFRIREMFMIKKQNAAYGMPINACVAVVPACKTPFDGKATLVTMDTPWYAQAAKTSCYCKCAQEFIDWTSRVVTKD